MSTLCRLTLTDNMRSQLNFLLKGGVFLNLLGDKPKFSVFYDTSYHSATFSLSIGGPKALCLFPCAVLELRMFRDAVVAEHMLDAGYVCSQTLGTGAELKCNQPLRTARMPNADSYFVFCQSYARILREVLGIGLNPNRSRLKAKTTRGFGCCAPCSAGDYPYLQPYALAMRCQVPCTCALRSWFPQRWSGRGLSALVFCLLAVGMSVRWSFQTPLAGGRSAHAAWDRWLENLYYGGWWSFQTPRDR